MTKTMKQWSAFAVVAFFLSATPAFANIGDYAHYWAFDEGIGRTVSDTSAQNGTITGSSTGLGWAGGKSRTALMMDGELGEGVTLPDGFLSGSEGTLSTWFRIEEQNERNVIFSGTSIYDGNIYALLSIDLDGRPQVKWRNESAGIDHIAQGVTILNRNEWYNLVLIAGGGAYKLYVNGEEIQFAGENIGRWFPDFTNHTLSYRIGLSEAKPFGGSWNGTLDEFRIYNRALSFNEVTALYNEGNAGQPSVPGEALVAEATIPVTEIVIPESVAPTPISEQVIDSHPIPELAITFGRNLTMGNRGDDVKQLQELLMREGFLVVNAATNYFGPLTNAALIKYQSQHGLPATGYFGPMTRAIVGIGSERETPAGQLGTSVTVTNGAQNSSKADVDATIANLMKMIAELQKQLTAIRAGN